MYFVVPFRADMNINGMAIYEAITMIFASQVFGIHLMVAKQVMVMLTAVLASVETVGIDRSLNMVRVIPNMTREYVSRFEKKAVEKFRIGMECPG